VGGVYDEWLAAEDRAERIALGELVQEHATCDPDEDIDID
jgi:hypothetical protein